MNRNNNAKKKTTTTHRPYEFKMQHANDYHPYPIPTTIHGVRELFYERYGGKEEARALYERGLDIYGDSLNQTAHRLVHLASMGQQQGDQQQQQPPILSMAFGGYSVTVGRGNMFQQSYPFVMERILQPLFLASALAIQVQVRNAAIGGAPSFPYGFCLPNFFGTKNPYYNNDVLGWDFAMNEGHEFGNANVMEAYIRHSITYSIDNNNNNNNSPQQQQQLPMMIVLDISKQRQDLLKQTVEEMGILKEAIVLKGRGNKYVNTNLIPKDSNINNDDDSNNNNIPRGYQQWQTFGAPRTCPGAVQWHPTYMEHEMMGWILSMYFVDALELATQLWKKKNIHDYMIMSSTSATTSTSNTVRGGGGGGGLMNNKKKNDDDDDGTLVTNNNNKKMMITFPLPQVLQNPTNEILENEVSILQTLYGHRVETTTTTNNKNDTAQLQIGKMSCRTNFLPQANNNDDDDNKKTLLDIVVSGISTTKDDEDDLILKRRIMGDYDTIRQRPKDIEYHSGWVLDVSDGERLARDKVHECGGTGSVDTKLALYGIPESGPLLFWLPSSSSSPYEDEMRMMTDSSSSSTTTTTGSSSSWWTRMMSSSSSSSSTTMSTTTDDASFLYDSLILCETHEFRTLQDKNCNLQTDLLFTIGGIQVSSSSSSSSSTGPKLVTKMGEFMDHGTCIYLHIPENAKVTRLSELKKKQQQQQHENNNNNTTSSSTTTIFDTYQDHHIGLELKVEVIGQERTDGSKVTRENGACCISHVVWEQPR